MFPVVVTQKEVASAPTIYVWAGYLAFVVPSFRPIFIILSQLVPIPVVVFTIVTVLCPAPVIATLAYAMKITCRACIRRELLSAPETDPSQLFLTTQFAHAIVIIIVLPASAPLLSVIRHVCAMVLFGLLLDDFVFCSYMLVLYVVDYVFWSIILRCRRHLYSS